MGKKKGGGLFSRGLASAGIIGLVFGSGSTGGGAPKKTADYGSSMYRSGSGLQRRQQSSAIRSGTNASGNRRRGSSQH